ncbi:MarR family winged helix-turn-helix transcriptional regulator [Cytobacillus gottheilii]|uniref:MarR family winged helix-turn-helix transcriptional regulator n=1 Tax=Cytobacillus gottheilii TaxID=859144 RepID=UPI0009BB5215|nr:MarR family transcriptional regulator [Cytobacillus gottheilii]
MNEVFVSILKTSKAIQDFLKQYLREYGLSTTEFAVLEVLYEHGKQTVHQIAGNVYLATGSMTYVIDKLVEKGYVMRSDCKEDRRVVHVEMATEGQRLMNDLYPSYKNAIDVLFEEVTESEMNSTISALGKIELKTK